ncbi:MAG: HAMP domain-containing histidine kinase [Sphingobacteriaceae bacterium]|nr:HAMP domain-containing histidine kinase [Sphingobacteriaceae bacterium]
MAKSKSYWYFTFAGPVFIAIAFFISGLNTKTIYDLANEAGKKIEAKANLCTKVLTRLIDSSENIKREEYYRLFEKEKIGVYLLKNGTGIFWNNSQIPLSDTLQTGQSSNGLLVVKRGYYLFTKVKKNNLVAFSLCLIKPDYDVQNNHLQNHFTDWTGLPENINLISEPANEKNVIVNGKTLFSIESQDELTKFSRHQGICSIIFFTGLLFIFLSLLLYIKRNPTFKNSLIAILILFIGRLFLYFSIFPSFLEETFLFDVRVFGNGQSYLNKNLADVFYNSTFLFFISLALFFTLSNLQTKFKKIISLISIAILLILSVYHFNESIRSFVINSTLSFDLLNVLNLNAPTLFTLFSLVVTSMAIFLFLLKSTVYFNLKKFKGSVWFKLYLSPVPVILFLFSEQPTLFQVTWLFLFALILLALLKLQFQKFSLGLGLLVAFMSATTAGIFNHYMILNQKSELSFLADKLSERQDSYLENEFADIPEKIKDDKNLEALISLLPETKKEIDQYLKLKYFKGYFKTYNVEFSLFNSDCKPLLEPNMPILLNEGFFEDQIKFYSDTTYSTYLFFASGYNRNTRYIGKIEKLGLNLYILMEKKQFEEQGSFPDLLLDASQQKHDKLKNLPHAVYRAGQRTNKYGEINYPYNLIDSTTLAKAESEYSHHFYTPDNSSAIIISEKIKNWGYIFTFNSYLFLIFSSFSFFSYFVYSIFFTQKFNTASLTRRIQSVIIILLLLAMSAVGITSGKLVTGQFEAENVKQLEEKTQAIINEFTTQFGKPDELFSTAQRELINLKLQEFSHLYHSDISFFDSEGGLFNTSQMKLYELGLAAPIANPKAYFAIKENKTSSMCVTEKAGTLNYLSLYTPVFNEQNKLIGFINLPYFARQNDLTNELSNIISALINVYVILFVISIVAGLILAGYITKPLRLIKQQISNITLGTRNEGLKWNSNDEVGKLVNEYNQMLLKLEQSANLLAQSEREGAWREMAKQVAHEIKNPLTPMKLNLQYLQHVMNSNPDDFKEKFTKASNSIIEQIDTLAAIATEFSNFAKLPGTNLSSINILEVIQSSVNLFDRKEANIVCDFPMQELWVTGDKEQALRVFNNILKNAIQACKDSEQPLIRLNAEVYPNTYVIRISDNGCGIPNEMKDKIFTPNFTTKSSGSGLGLAMVKNIMSSFGGKIWFESEKEKGTTFYVQFDRAD